MDSEFKKNFAAGKKVRINSRAQKNLKKNCRKNILKQLQSLQKIHSQADKTDLEFEKIGKISELIN